MDSHSNSVHHPQLATVHANHVLPDVEEISDAGVNRTNRPDIGARDGYFKEFRQIRRRVKVLTLRGQLGRYSRQRRQR